jgi:hypothetical protein
MQHGLDTLEKMYNTLHPLIREITSYKHNDQSLGTILSPQLVKMYVTIGVFNLQTCVHNLIHHMKHP